MAHWSLVWMRELLDAVMGVGSWYVTPVIPPALRAKKPMPQGANKSARRIRVEQMVKFRRALRPKVANQGRGK